MPSVYSLQKGAKALNQQTLGKVELSGKSWIRIIVLLIRELTL